MKTKHWASSPEMLEYVSKQLPRDAYVLEIGPGPTPFHRSTSFIDRVSRPDLLRRGPVEIVDVTKQPLPFKDKSVDFIYCRHVVEDLYDPFLLLREMNRIGKAGYIETPSPICELNRGVDGGNPAHRGYVHHRWVVWAGASGVLSLVEKSVSVEHMSLPDASEQLETDPFLWNTYLFWKDEFRFKHYEHDFDFQLHVNYGALLQHAITCSMKDAARIRKLVTT